MNNEQYTDMRSIVVVVAFLGVSLSFRGVFFFFFIGPLQKFALVTKDQRDIRLGVFSMCEHFPISGSIFL